MTTLDSSLTFRPCLLIPCYNHGPALVRMLDGWLAAQQQDESLLPCLIVDDGSQPETVQLLDELVARHAWITLLRLPLNQGKGGAVSHGLRQAAALGFTHALQLDADGQHDLADVRRGKPVACRPRAVPRHDYPFKDGQGKVHLGHARADGLHVRHDTGRRVGTLLAL